MAIDFPNSPTVGDTYITNGKQYRWDGTAWGIYGTFSPDSTASDTEPSGVGDGHIWYRSDQSQTLIRYDNTWVEVGSAGGFNSSSTNFPTSLDSATGFAAIEALQAKVGVNSSAVTTSHDYKIAQLEAAGTWSTWTPTISTTGGTITSGTLGLARYSQVGNLIFVRFRYSVTTAGTATGTQLNFTLPVALSSTYSNNDALGTGRETAVTGYGFNVFVNGSLATTQFYDGSGWIQDGRTASLVLWYEVD